MPSDVAIGPGGDIYIADMHHQRVRRVDARTRTISTIAGTGTWGHTGDGGPATEATLAGPAGVTVVPETGGQVTVYVADYYNGRVRAIGPDGVIRDVGGQQRVEFGAPTRVAYAARRGSLWVADSTLDRLVALIIRRPPVPAALGTSGTRPPAPTGAQRRAAE
jgi:hypothetical protein